MTTESTQKPDTEAPREAPPDAPPPQEQQQQQQAQAPEPPQQQQGRDPQRRGDRGPRGGDGRSRGGGPQQQQRRDPHQHHHHHHHHHRGRDVDFAPPRFNVDELAALAGPPLWQSVHDAVIAEVTDVAVFVEVRPLGHDPLRAAVPPQEVQGKEAGAALRVRLLDPPKKNEGVPTASPAQAGSLDALDKLVAATDKREAVPGWVVREVKGGFSVALFADDDAALQGTVRAFLPASQASLSRFGPRSTEVVGKPGAFDIVELEPERANVVVSAKAHLAAERKQSIVRRLEEIKEGDVVKAVVKTIVAYGAFLDVGGLDGMVHQSDLTWDGRSRSQDVLKVGQTLDVKVLSKNPETGKIKLGVKQVIPDPWADLRAAFSEGAVVEGTVVALAEFGAFVRLNGGVEGLIHVSEISWTKVKHPSQKLKIGDVIQVKVLGLDTQARRISLSTKALEKNPFEAVAEKFPIGTVVKVKIKSLAEFGAFVELAEGVDGLIHVGEISWTEHPHHPAELLNIAQEVEAVVVNIDVAKQRVGLSIKRTSENPYDTWEKKYRKGARMKLKVIRVDEKGAFFGVEEGLSCFCFVRDLVGKEGDGRVDRASEAVRIGQEIEIEVKNFDRRFKKVSVSARAVIEGDTREAYQDYKKQEKAADTRLNPLADKLKALMEKKGG